MWGEAESESDDDDAYDRRVLKQRRKVCTRNNDAALCILILTLFSDP